MWALPPPMRSWITGAERTTPSRMMARRRLTFSPVILPNSSAPRRLKSHRDVRLVVVADAHRGVFDGVAGEQDLLFQQQGLALDPAGVPVDALFDVDFVLRRDLVGQGLVELLPGIAGLQLAVLEGLFDQFRQVEAGAWSSTSLNSNWAVWPMRSRARWGSWMPGSCTTICSAPWRTSTGSVTPNWSMRLRRTSRLW